MNKIKSKLYFELTSKRFWIIQLVFALFGLTLGLLFKFAANHPYLTAIAVATFIVFLIDLLILIFKWGFLERTIKRLKESFASTEKARNERNYKKMNDAEKRAFERIQKQKELKKQARASKVKTNFTFYFTLFISLAVALIFIPLSTYV